MVRKVLRNSLGEKEPAENENKLLNSVRQRVANWNLSAPFYGESSGPNKSSEARSTEAVLNALVLADANTSRGELNSEALAAFENMWALQTRSGDQKGSWDWLDFGNEPFESTDSRYYGAGLAALAAGKAPASYRERPDVRNHLSLLRGYIGREVGRQPVIHRVVSLWASTGVPDLLTPEEKKSIIDEILSSQQSDGGWSLSTLGWTWRGSGTRTLYNIWFRSNDTPWVRKSDGYATGLIVHVLQLSGFNREDARLQRGRRWLIEHQDKSKGFWPGYSLVNRRNPGSGTGLFMTDAATAYAVLALSD
jgi:hypothetical protein